MTPRFSRRRLLTAASVAGAASVAACTGGGAAASASASDPTFDSLRLRTRRDGVAVRRIALYDDGASATVSADAMVARLAAAIRPRTRVLAVTWVHSGTGVKLPIRAVADMLAPVNADRPPAE